MKMNDTHLSEATFKVYEKNGYASETYTLCGLFIDYYHTTGVVADHVRFLDEDTLRGIIQIPASEVTCTACILLKFAEGAEGAEGA